VVVEYEASSGDQLEKSPYQKEEVGRIARMNNIKPAPPAYFEG
jgi:hypothetical protein